MEQMRIGQLPPVDAYDGRTGQPLKPENLGAAPLEWKAEQTLTLHVSDYWQDIQTKLSNFGASTEPSKVSLHLGPFYFQDGMMWGAGAYKTPVPEDPGKFKSLPDNYFPGKRGHNWPPSRGEYLRVHEISDTDLQKIIISALEPSLTNSIAKLLTFAIKRITF